MIARFGQATIDTGLGQAATNAGPGQAAINSGLSQTRQGNGDVGKGATMSAGERRCRPRRVNDIPAHPGKDDAGRPGSNTSAHLDPQGAGPPGTGSTAKFF